MNLAIPAIVFGAVGTAGQRCTTTRRLLVPQSMYDAVCQRLVNAYQQVTIGDPLDQQNLMGPLVDQQAVNAYQQAIADAQVAGGEVLCGGKVLERSGCYVEPTIIKAQNDWQVVQHESFAPILYVIAYPDGDLAKAIELQNAVPQGLSSAIFSDRLQAAEQFLSAGGSDCGIANVNIGTSGAEIGGALQILVN